jgi:hypothetical protein
VDDPTFDDLFAVATRASGRFGHREHVHLTWLAVRRLGADAAASLVGDGIRRTARYAGVPQKYNGTMSLAWTRAQRPSGVWSGCTRSAGGGGGGGVPSPNGRPPSCSRPCGVSQPASSGPRGTIPVGLMSRCTS